jgi:hypothetical protein
MKKYTHQTVALPSFITDEAKADWIAYLFPKITIGDVTTYPKQNESTENTDDNIS